MRSRKVTPSVRCLHVQQVDMLANSPRNQISVARNDQVQAGEKNRFSSSQVPRDANVRHNSRCHARATGNVVSTVVTPLHEHCTPNLAWAWPESKRREGATPDSPRMVARIVD